MSQNKNSNKNSDKDTDRFAESAKLGEKIVIRKELQGLTVARKRLAKKKIKDYKAKSVVDNALTNNVDNRTIHIKRKPYSSYIHLRPLIERLYLNGVKPSIIALALGLHTKVLTTRISDWGLRELKAVNDEDLAIDMIEEYVNAADGVKENLSFSITVTPDDATIHYGEWTFDFPDSANMGTISKAMLQAAMDTRNRLRRRLREINIQNARDEQEEREALEVVNTIVAKGNE